MPTVTLRKHGHSVALTIPPTLLRELSADAGTQLNISVIDGRLVAEPRRRPKYNLAELMAGCEELPAAEGWDALPPQGSEVL